MTRFRFVLYLTLAGEFLAVASARADSVLTAMHRGDRNPVLSGWTQEGIPGYPTIVTDNPVVTPPRCWAMTNGNYADHFNLTPEQGEQARRFGWRLRLDVAMRGHFVSTNSLPSFNFSGALLDFGDGGDRPGCRHCVCRGLLRHSSNP